MRFPLFFVAAGLMAFALPAQAANHRQTVLHAFAEGNARAVDSMHVDASDVPFRNLACAAKLANGARGEAIACWNTLLADHPGDPAAADNLGALALREGDAAAAAERFGRALDIDFSDGAALAGLAQVDLMRGDPVAAAKHATAALACEPDHLGAWTALGFARWANGDAAGSAEAFAHVTDIDSHNALAWARLGIALMAQGHADSAHAAFAKSSDWAPDDAFVRAMIANAPGAPHTISALHLEPGYGVCFAGPREWVRLCRGHSLTIEASNFLWASRRARLAVR